jgi:hypothetical protein
MFLSTQDLFFSNIVDITCLSCRHDNLTSITHTKKTELSLEKQQQQQHSIFSQASWGRLQMKPERNKFKVQAH